MKSVKKLSANVPCGERGTRRHELTEGQLDVCAAIQGKKKKKRNTFSRNLNNFTDSFSG